MGGSTVAGGYGRCDSRDTDISFLGDLFCVTVLTTACFGTTSVRLRAEKECLSGS